ncbi:dihydrofolate reductase [Mycobacterium antarcticum]|uniref:dihydrofolate reductase family protein n=1 Tax=Mycolicibacterium sp. TUM20983 TaxID=3023369 RepID=UPI0023978E25|nr:dihydrofolate reductase family protein [Mycolicibacterium sp. TUM20983]GLP78048.1 dihydrofolate reductase [Mycolicibacterium sp. TUM20983]
MGFVYYTASSLDGFVVDEANSLDWLTSRSVDAKGPFGYEAFADDVGALVRGSATYEWILTNHPGDWMYEQPTWVLTHRSDVIADGHPVQTFTGEVAELAPTLASAAAGRDVWVVGGGVVAAQFVAAGLIDEMVITYAPCSLGAGAQVLPLHSEWVLRDVGRNADFVCARWARAA